MVRERTERSARRLLPEAISLLEEMRSGLSGTDQDFARQCEELAARQRQQGDARTRHSEALDAAKDRLRRSIEAACRGHAPLLAASRDPAEARNASGAFVEALDAAVQREFRQFGETFVANLDGQTRELEAMIQRVNRLADVGSSVVTAAITAVIIPGAGLAVNAAEGAAGAAAQAGTQTLARRAAQEVGESTLKTIAVKVFKAINDLNPVSVASDLVAEKIKSGRVIGEMDRIAATVASDASRALEDHFEREHFRVIDEEIASIREMLDEVERERRRDASARRSRAAGLAADIAMLRSLNDEVC